MNELEQAIKQYEKVVEQNRSLQSELVWQKAQNKKDNDYIIELEEKNMLQEEKLNKIEEIVLIKCKTCLKNMPRYCDREKFEYCKFSKILQILEGKNANK